MTSLMEAKLYGILDLGYTPLAQAVQTCSLMLQGGVQCVQLRGKQVDQDTLADLARKLVVVCRTAGIPFVVNDFPAIAREVEADGVHVGQDDLSVAQARELCGGGLVGKSTHSLDQARAAQKEGADYIGFGPLFATPTKPDYEPIGTDAIATVHRELSIPIFCIGGIKKENLVSIRHVGARRVVIVSGILQAPDIVSYCRECRKLLDD